MNIEYRNAGLLRVYGRVQRVGGVHSWGWWERQLCCQSSLVNVMDKKPGCLPRVDNIAPNRSAERCRLVGTPLFGVRQWQLKGIINDVSAEVVVCLPWGSY